LVEEFLDFLKEAERELQALDEKEFHARAEIKEKRDFLERYVQHASLDGRNMTPYLVLEGEATNLTRMHCGNGLGGPNISIVKRVIRGGTYRPILSDNALNGMFRIPLRDISREYWKGDKNVDYCGIYRQVGNQRAAIDCGYCFSCGLSGWMRTIDNKNAPHKVRAASGVSENGRIIIEYHNRPDRVKHTMVHGEDFPLPLKVSDAERKQIESLMKEKGVSGDVNKLIEVVFEGLKRAPAPFAEFYQFEYVAPGANFPIWVSFRDVAPAEFGLALEAFSFAWLRLGIGRGKLGKLQFWDTGPEGWKIHAFMNLHSGPQTYPEQVKEIVTLAKNCAELALAKKLFRRYEEPDVARVDVIESARQEIERRVREERRKRTGR